MRSLAGQSRLRSAADPLSGPCTVTVRPRKDHRGIDLISDALPLGRLWYDERDAIDYAKFRSRSHNTAVRVCDEAGKVGEKHEDAGDSKSDERYAHETKSRHAVKRDG
ncbi:MAG: hypothetical protein WA496_13540 [Candidatus Udaeobacter sp.]